MIQAETFDINKMLENLLVYGFYCFHDKRLENLLDDSTIWELQDRENFYHGINKEAVEKCKEIQIELFKDLHRNIKAIDNDKTGISSGIDNYTDVWHNDSREQMSIQTLCYQDDLYEGDGGYLELRCYDNIERKYYPKNGDVMIMNHHNGIYHRVELLKTNKRRAVINLIFNYE